MRVISHEGDRPPHMPASPVKWRDLWDEGLYDAPIDHRSQSMIVMMSVFSSSDAHRYLICVFHRGY